MSDDEKLHPSTSLGALRVAIDAVDDEILALLGRRAELATEVAAKKHEAGGAFYVPARERAIIDRLQAQNRGPFPQASLRPVFQEIISACLSLEAGVRVAYLGPEATFTHQAVKRHFGTSAAATPCGSITGVFEEVERGQAAFGVVPVENSSEGVVSHTLDSFVHSPLKICAEIVVDVDHCLLARAGVTESAIERVYSHPQALAQCRRWLAQNLARAKVIEAASTADAARAAREDAGGAAIAAELASRIYGLSVLRRGLQDVADNVTRFLVISDLEPPPPVTADDGAGSPDKTSVVLALPDEPGCLVRILERLSRGGVNLTRIESRPSRRKPWEYVFFLDLDGHCRDPRIAPVLAELATTCELFKILGSYRKADSA
ncbi:MAG TPA: prephenate dehydratase [Kofleriaceae bacterium]|nr:prephenate dehydratase [Kofleriaceae bacterium]